MWNRSERPRKYLRNPGSNGEKVPKGQRIELLPEQLLYHPQRVSWPLSVIPKLFSEQLLNQATIFRTEYYSLIKYDSLYMINLVDNFQVLSELKEKFKIGQQALLRKKEKPFLEGQVDKW